MSQDGPKNACSAKWCDVCKEMDRKKREGIVPDYGEERQ
jgi:hypothetical protein